MACSGSPLPGSTQWGTSQPFGRGAGAAAFAPCCMDCSRTPGLPHAALMAAPTLGSQTRTRKEKKKKQEEKWSRAGKTGHRPSKVCAEVRPRLISCQRAKRFCFCTEMGQRVVSGPDVAGTEGSAPDGAGLGRCTYNSPVSTDTVTEPPLRSRWEGIQNIRSNKPVFGTQ